MPNDNELTPEGQELWNMIGQPEVEFIGSEEISGKRGKRTQTPVEKNMRIEIKKMIQNSKIVVAETAIQVEFYTKREEYFKANEAKVAGTIHANFITRLESLLRGSRVFTPEQELRLEVTDDDLSESIRVR